MMMLGSACSMRFMTSSFLFLILWKLMIIILCCCECGLLLLIGLEGEEHEITCTQNLSILTVRNLKRILIFTIKEGTDIKDA